MNVDRGILSFIRKFLKRIGLSLLLYQVFFENRKTLQVWACAWRYRKLRKLARCKPKGAKIRVLFIVSEIAKWKEKIQFWWL